MPNATAAAVLYKRKSRDPRNTASIEDQDRLGRADVEQQGWRLAAALDDAGRSASRFATRGRDDWETLLGMISAGQAGAVWLWESSRGDRRLTTWSAFLDLCRERGVLIRVYTHDRTYDPRNHRDWETLATDGVRNAAESEQISVRVRRGQSGAALRGEPYGPVPYGYRAVYSPDTGKRTGWEIIPERAEHVRHLVQWVGAHRAVTALVRDFAARGVPSPGGKPQWEQATIRDMGRNPVYAGLRQLADGTLIEGRWPAIVTRQEWADACAALGTRSQARPGAQRHLLSHLAQCGECDAPMVGKRREDRWYYRCKDSCFSIGYDWLDDVVSGVMVARLSRADAREVFRRDDARSAAMAGELATLKARRDSFRDKAAEGDLDADALAAIEAKLTPKIEAKQRELDTLTLPPALHQVLGADDIAGTWAGMPVQARRAVISALAESITVTRPPRRWRWMVLPDPADFGELVEFKWREFGRL